MKPINTDISQSSVKIYDARGNGGWDDLSDTDRGSPEQNNGLYGNRYYPYTQTGFGQYAEGVGTLKANGGDVGGERDITRHLIYTDTVGAICARDFKGIGNQYVNEGKLIIEVFRNDS